MAKASDHDLTRKVLQSVLVHRDGKPTTPEIGKPFKFTQGEIDEITKRNPRALAAPAEIADVADDGSEPDKTDTPVTNGSKGKTVEKTVEKPGDKDLGDL